MIDRLSLPGLTRWFGRRRAWMLLSQILLLMALWSLSTVNPSDNLMWTAWLALVVAFLSATQDIVIDAYRVDILEEETYGAGAATVVFGYRIGMLVSGAGALYLAAYFPWPVVYQWMALFMLVGVFATLFGKEPLEPITSGQEGHNWFYEAAVAPFLDFIKRTDWAWILVFVVLYKLGDAFISNMTSPFYLATGFSKIEIANITKIFGVAAMLFGAFVGGWIVARLGILKALFVCGVLQMLSNLVFVLQAYVGYDVSLLVFTIAVENVTGGMGTVALVAYLSKLCHTAFTATQYALLSSLTAVGRTFLASPAGILADSLSWPIYFSVSMLVAMPALLLLLYLMRNEEHL